MSSNRVPFDTWERVYARHLINMYKIFVGAMGNAVPKEYLTFDNFNRLIYESSSGELSPNVQPENSTAYMDYLTQRNAHSS